MSTLKQLLSDLSDARMMGKGDPEISGIAYDSRQVQRNNAFVCIKGLRHDGHAFIPQALERGAAAIIGDDLAILQSLPAQVKRVLVADSRRTLALLGCAFYEHPSQELTLIGVTGTNGKTTSSHLIASVLRESGRRVGIIGTLGAVSELGTVELGRTTPESVDLQAQLAEYLEAGIEAVVMEVSSHSLSLARVEGCAFDAGVFTNVTQDHLDFHSNLEDYFKAKSLLFTEYADKSSAHKAFGAVINTDDPSGRRLAEMCSHPVVTYGIERDANVAAEAIQVTAQGTSFVVRTATTRTQISLKLTGRFNVYNALAAFGIAELRGLEPSVAQRALEAVASMPGRLEMIDEGQDFGVAVDYAHTPDGLRNVISTAREITAGQLIVVFGCGGDRDRGKRSQMGGVASAFADICVITSDNPRSEDPEAILKDIRLGIVEGGAECVFQVDRRRAIEEALSRARRGDFVLLAGKGHETYQIVKDRTLPFDDRDVARQILRRMARAYRNS